MSKPFSPKVVTANDLLDGDVIYQSASGWTRELSEAEVLTDPAIADLRLIEAHQLSNVVVGAYLMNVTLTAQGPAPAHIRENLRATGPSNYVHGKQAEHPHV